MLHVVKNTENDLEDVIPPVRQERIAISLQYFKHYSQASVHTVNFKITRLWPNLQNKRRQKNMVEQNYGQLILLLRWHFIVTTKSFMKLKGKGSPYSITERRFLELILVLGSQPAGDMSQKPSGRLPLLSARPTVTLATLKRAATNRCLVNRGTMGVNSLPKTASRLRLSPAR